MNKYLLLFLCCINFIAKAQNSANKKAQESFEDAQQYIRQNIFDEGIKQLEAAVKADSKFQQAYIQLGDVHKRLKNYAVAKEKYQKAIGSAPNISTKVYYDLAECELLSGDYLAAKTNFLNFKNKYLGNDTKLVDQTNKYILDCNFAIEAIKKPVKYEPINMGFYINSEHRDYFPALTADNETIIFSRVVNGNEDFYTSTKKDNEWQKAKPLSNQINTPNYNEGAQSISPDGKYLFFTGCNRTDGYGRCDIYIAIKEGNEWGKVKNLGNIVNSDFWEAQPAISPDGNTLYFVSNRLGGIGGYDIWKSTLTDEGSWTEPINLGPQINTPYDESTPFMHADGKTLYFSSDGWPGLGKKDIFMSQLNHNGVFSEPVNLGYPINSFNDETGFIVTANGNEGLFSSDFKNGGFGNFDIYRFKIPSSIKPNPTTYIKGIVKDSKSKNLLSASVLVVDIQSNTAVFNDFTDEETASFLTVTPIGSKYLFHVQADGYAFYSKHIELNDSTSVYKPLLIEILLEKLEKGNKVNLENVFFDTNKFDLLPASKIELELLAEMLQRNNNLSIEISGHTDNEGSEKLNQKLSENRAKAVYDFLIANGIEKKRLSYRGYGASQPKSNNQTNEGKQLNRRTEFLITSI
jgi:outer membrane protein OmpA-like peptidoglycan-associated protein/Tol biopolymer transport system component